MEIIRIIIIYILYIKYILFKIIYIKTFNITKIIRCNGIGGGSFFY